MTRREFARNAALAALPLSCSRARGADRAENPPPGGRPVLPIVDTHQHLWDLTKFRLPWLAGAGALNRSFVTKDYLEAAEGLNIVKAVYMEVDVVPEQHAAEAEYVIELCKGKGNVTCAAVIGGRPGSEGFRDYIARFKGNRYVKGVRQVLSGGAKQCLEEAFVGNIRHLGELGLSFDICLGPTALPIAAQLVEKCPETRFILDHCGNGDPKAFGRLAKEAREKGQALSHGPDQWRRDIERLAKARNVVCKLSGIVAGAPKGWAPGDLAPIVNHCIESFGPDRAMFASDWPVCTRGATLRQWVEALEEILRTRPEPDQRKLLHDNAVRFYGLTP
jgi:predicted TIM-barrel fold metal-dependent hydrolase